MHAQLVGSQFAGNWVLFLFSAETPLLTHKGLWAFWLAPVEKKKMADLLREEEWSWPEMSRQEKSRGK